MTISRANYQFLPLFLIIITMVILENILYNISVMYEETGNNHQSYYMIHTRETGSIVVEICVMQLGVVHVYTLMEMHVKTSSL